MRYLSLFSGIGGFELGIQQAYENYNSSRQQTEQISEDLPQHLSDTKRSDGDGRRDSPTCIGYSEVDKYAIQIYEKHFPKHKNYGDITKIKAEELPDFELLCGGFPCQSFSIAGKRMGFSDTRGTLFFEIARIAREKQPRLLLLENVKGLLSHDKGITFYTIISTLDELGYDLQWQVLNSKNFGVPQNRERVFIIGHLRGTSRPEVFPFGEVGKEVDGIQQEKQGSGNRIQGEVSETERDSVSLESGGTGIGRPSLRQLKGGSQGERVYDPRGIATTIASQAGGQGAKTGLYVVKPVLTPDRLNKRQHGRRIKEDGEPSFTLTSQDKHGVMIDAAIRRLTPTECERLQGFPDGWTEGVSDTQRYKTLGNAVTVNVIKEIVKNLACG